MFITEELLQLAEQVARAADQLRTFCQVYLDFVHPAVIAKQRAGTAKPATPANLGELAKLAESKLAARTLEQEFKTLADNFGRN
jgi:hypothetical protein